MAKVGISLNRSTEKAKKVYNLVKKIPKGKVTTYRAVSEVAGIHPRAVGMILHVNPDPVGVPCYRVVKSDGQLGGYGGAGGVRRKKELLMKDGIEIKENRVNLKKHFHGF